jgi:hypothetical protein
MRRALGVVALAAAGCTSQWYEGPSTRDVVTTDVVVHTEPEGATILFNGKEQKAPSPIRVPVRYDHTTTMWERQTNAGESMREGMGTLTTILTFPIWGIASFFHSKEEVLRHTYEGGTHQVTALLPGYDQADETVTLKGEAEKTVTIPLVKSK